MSVAKLRKRTTVVRAAATACVAGIALYLASIECASAYYIGPAYLRVPGITGGAMQQPYEGWIRTEANYWTKRPVMREIRGISGAYSVLQFTGPRAPASGPEMLAVSIDKSSPALPALMEQCRRGLKIPEVTFAESSELARHSQEHGPRPADVPEYYEYALKGVDLTCPVVDGAPEQAFVIHFDAIVWTNYHPQPKPVPISATAAPLPPAPTGGASKVFVVSWLSPVADSRDDQCPMMNTKPTQDEYYALMSKERAAEQRAALASQGGANTTNLPYRGPDEMNVCMLPGIVPDPGLIEPRAEIVQGFDLDGDDGTGKPPKGTRKHRNYTSPDGRKGIDNQLFNIEGCVAGWRRKGFMSMIGNELRRAGGLSILIEISGIDDDVAVTILYSTDPMRRDSASKGVLPHYTFRVSDQPQFTQSFARFHGRIVDGVIVTEPLKQLWLHEGVATTTSWMGARLRLEIQPDGTLRGTLGGYRDWREVVTAALFRSSDYENTIGFQCPAVYDAVRRSADGLPDPVTGEFDGISAADEIEGIPAFIPPAQHQKLVAQTPDLLAPGK